MFFVFDVETIPDFEFVRQVIENPEDNEDDLLIQASEELARNSSGFLPPMFHKMISWVGLWIENNGAPKQKAAWHGTDEKEGLESLFDTLSTYKDFGLVHHNGRGFDLPLLTYRALKHGMQMPKRLNHYDIKYRYSNDNVDLLDEFSNYGASSWPKLKHLGYLIGIPFKQTGEGNEVLQMFRDDKLPEIEHYCYEDVMATYVVWLHLKFTVGDISKELFDNLNDRAMKKLDEIQQGQEM
ncbi:MAG TPA: ribonuclease H-like domain-containing protein [Balneolaceae bacterium]|nr:ribonuclease H-like domain-containing protein [Balneolaceae bacterium]